MRTSKLILIFLIMAATALSGCSNTTGQKNHVIVGIVNADSNFAPFIVGFKNGMASAGYIEGENVTYLYDGPTPKDQIVNRLNLLKKQDIDLLYTTTTPVTQKAYKIFADSKTPVIFAPVFSPIEAGLVDAKTRCGKNITGVKVRGSTAKALGYLMECLPSLKTIFVPFHHHELPAQLTFKDLKKEADKFGITLLTADIDNKDDLTKALQNIPKETDAVWMTHSRLIVANAHAIIQAATKQNLPVVSPASQYRNGALLSYAPNPQSMGQQAGRLAVKVLGGIDVSKIPVEPAEYLLGINLVMAKKLGIEIRNDILREADFIKR